MKKIINTIKETFCGPVGAQGPSGPKGDQANDYPHFIYVKYHSEAARPIEQAHFGEWCDLRLAESVHLNRDESKLLSLGVSIELPLGFEAIMAPRSSTFKKYGIIQTNSIGVIDNSYCGENDIWHFPAYATRGIYIEAGTRIAQFRILPIQNLLKVVEVNKLRNENRGGLGSTDTSKEYTSSDELKLYNKDHIESYQHI